MDRIGGIGVGIAVGWNIAVIGPIATRLAHVYGVSLTVVLLFVTVQFVVHMLMQIPGGRAADRFGARNSALLGLVLSLTDQRPLYDCFSWNRAGAHGRRRVP